MTELGKKEVERFNKAALSIVDAGDAFIKDYDRFPAIYLKMFGVYPNIIDLDSEGLYLNKDADPENAPVSASLNMDGQPVAVSVEFEEPVVINSDDDEDESLKKYRFKAIDYNKSFIKLVETYPDAGIVRNYDFPIIIYKNTIIYWHKYQREFCVLQDTPELHDWIIDCIIEKEDDDDKRYFEYVTYGQGGFDTLPLEVKKQDIDIDMNYNDSLPDEEIQEFLNSKESGLLILHGKPGTGKTNYIRYLIYSLKKKDFLILDNSVFNYITDSSFISLLLDYKNAVIILEDCEDMLKDRIAGNGKLAALLNLADGIIGDAFNFKFLCTFNANIGKIDKAILREGRMKIKYEFKALTPEKTTALAKKLGKNILEGESKTLAEIYNYGEKTDYTEADKKIGFNK